MICSRYFRKSHCLAAISFTLIHSPPLLFNARSSMTRTAYLPLVEIFILSSFPSIFLLLFHFLISACLFQSSSKLLIFYGFTDSTLFFLYFLFPIVHIDLAITTRKNLESIQFECCSGKILSLPFSECSRFSHYFTGTSILTKGITPPL